MIGPSDISKDVQALLQLADGEILEKTMSSLTPLQRNSQAVKEIGRQRFLSALRAGSVDSIEITKILFNLDTLFLTSKIVKDAGEYGMKLKQDKGQHDIVERIKSILEGRQLPVATQPTAVAETKALE